MSTIKSKRDIKIGFIGFGEVPYYMAKGFKKAGTGQVFAYARALMDVKRRDFIIKRGDEAGVELLDDLVSLVEVSDIIFSSVHGHVSLQVAKQSAPYLRQGQIFADLNNSVPSDKKKAAELIGETGAIFVDVGLMGLPVQKEHKALMYVSGEGAGTFKEVLEPYGMQIVMVPGEAGKAATIKALANIYMKGLQGVCLEFAMSALKADVDLEILEPLLVNPLLSLPREKDVAFWIIRGALLAERKKAEMSEAVRMLEDLGIEPFMLEATVKRLSHAAQFGLNNHFDIDMDPIDYQKLIHKMISIGHEKGIDIV